ncbi:MAG: signal peptidase I [Caldilineae bacterium]|nr:MAG: signal peptidase I [Caldilineae bacterium]
MQGLREMVETVLPAVLIALLIHLFLAQATRVEGYSMEPTLYGHQRLVIEKISYHLHPPHRGDIVVLRVPGYGQDMLIKRVIGLPGETIEIKDGVVFINGQILPEPYLDGSARGNYPSTLIPPDYYFVMGDNRNNSNDSRSFGPVPRDAIVGRAWLRYWPPYELGLVE